MSDLIFMSLNEQNQSEKCKAAADDPVSVFTKRQSHSYENTPLQILRTLE